MKICLRLLSACVAAAAARGAEDVFDRVEEELSVSAFHDQLRARVSGLLDLEQYHFQLPAPGVIRATGNDLFNPRLVLFLDAQLGAKVYVFAQSRAAAMIPVTMKTRCGSTNTRCASRRGTTGG